ncbi:MAG: Serine protease Do (heat-shock protein) [Candidatus Methanohalarchaeum thermophilum]|uniref:Serine protease Do (Heat-shock protein) n=1 Tax=Methanohalarchaeum thermophilum TaxID=1903181 RepID=A0A1Q6DTM1_METT1|nr:MAG: Serine protease Do (heat-shock protein) [Candidatus Methanohalarchaeum thermophilum]
MEKIGSSRGNSKKRLIYIAFVFLLIGLLIGIGSLYVFSEPGDSDRYVTNKNITININGTNSYQEEIYQALYNNLSDSVVSIRVSSISNGEAILSQGSGFIYDNNGHIITNQHVVDGGDSFRVIFSNGIQKKASLVGTDIYSDIAVLKVDSYPTEGIDPTPLKLANSSKVEPGEMVIAIGNPFGLSGTITHGIISATGRTLPTEGDFSIPNVIQTDCAVNPGNSGGPLLDLSGDVVGVVRAKQGDNIGFAIPSNKAEKVASSIIEKGEYDHAWLGIRMLPVTMESAEEMNLSDEAKKGIMVIEVIEDSPAEEAGLKEGEKISVDEKPVWINGDIITEVNGHEITSTGDLISELSKESPGDEVTLKIYRNQEFIDVTVELEKRPND